MAEPLWPELPVQERLARKFAMEADRKDYVEHTPPVVLLTETIDIDQLPAPVKAVANLLTNIRVHHSQTFQEGAVFKSGAKQGQKRPDKTIDHYSVDHFGKNPLTAYWSDGKLQYAKGFRKGQWYYTDKVTELKNWLKEDGGWE